MPQGCLLDKDKIPIPPFQGLCYTGIIMAVSVNLSPNARVFPKMPLVPGVSVSVAASGMRYQGRDDLLLLQFSPPGAIAGVLTRSTLPAAPIIWCRSALRRGGQCRAIIVNAGNANAFTGNKGSDSLNGYCSALAERLGCAAESVFPASTGVIGETFNGEKISAQYDDLLSPRAQADWHRAARAIMTTDTFPKAAMQRFRLFSTEFFLVGIAKGSGMIAPNMATMLAFLVTNAPLSAPILQTALRQTVAQSFNAITVDGDQSTNDAVLLVSCGAPIQEKKTPNEAALHPFCHALSEVCDALAEQIVADGEGARKLLHIRVSEAPDKISARKIGMAVANSPLVKAALAGEDANWGRIVMAIGNSGIALAPERITISFGDVVLAQNGGPAEHYDAARLAEILSRSEIDIRIACGTGAQGEFYVRGCDLTRDYVSINADYRN